MARPPLSRRLALLDMGLEIADCAARAPRSRAARPARPTSRSASRMVRPLLRSRAASMLSFAYAAT